MDAHDRLARLPRSSRLTGLVARFTMVGIGGIVVIGLLLALATGVGKGEPVFELMAMLIAVLLAIPGGFLAYRSIHRYWSRTRALPYPGRWALALPAADHVAVVHGTLRSEQLLRSPILGEACVAYEIGIRYDANGTGPLGTWLLLEQRCADFTLAEAAFDGARVFLEIPRRQIDVADDDPRLSHFLHERGIRSGQETLYIYASTVHNHQAMVARTGSNGVVTLRPEP
jgi:hypothetical protein